MKTNILFILLFSGLTILSYSQINTLNQLDSKNKKNGKWILYYNDYWKVVKDSSEAFYYGYTYYDHGTRIYTEATWGSKNGKLEDSLSSHQQMGKIKLLDGKYSWFDAKGKLFSIHYYNKGEPVWCKQFYPSGKLYLYFDYMKKCDGQPESWCLNMYDKNGNLKSVYPMCKHNDGRWPKVR